MYLYDGLFDRLRNSGYGCYIGSTFSDTFGYGDDAIFIASSLHNDTDIESYAT